MNKAATVLGTSSVSSSMAALMIDSRWCGALVGESYIALIGKAELIDKIDLMPSSSKRKCESPCLSACACVHECVGVHFWRTSWRSSLCRCSMSIQCRCV